MSCNPTSPCATATLPQRLAKPRFGGLNAAPSPVHAGSYGASASPASCASAIEPLPTKGLMAAPTLRRTKPAQSRGWLSSLLRSATLHCMRLLTVCANPLSVKAGNCRPASSGVAWANVPRQRPARACSAWRCSCVQESVCMVAAWSHHQHLAAVCPGHCVTAG